MTFSFYRTTVEDTEVEFNFFLETRNNKLQAYQRYVFYLNLSGNLANMYREQLMLFDKNAFILIDEIISYIEEHGINDLKLRLKYKINEDFIVIPSGKKKKKSRYGGKKSHWNVGGQWRANALI